jgi:hypothetical protein
MSEGGGARRFRKAKVALTSVVAVFAFYGCRELRAGAREEGMKAWIIAAVAAALLLATVLATRPRRAGSAPSDLHGTREK